MTAATAPTGQLAPTISLGTRLAGFSHLLALAWRRDRILIPSSVLGLVVLAVGSAQATLALYPTDEAASTGLASVLSNPSVIALYGPIASHTADALAVFKTLMMGAFLTAVLGLRRRATAHPHRGGRGAPGAARRRGRRPLVGARRRRDPGDDRRRRRQRALRCRARRPRHGRHREHRVRDRLDDGRPRHDRSQRRRCAARLDHPRRGRPRLRLPRRDVRAAGHRRLRRPRLRSSTRSGGCRRWAGPARSRPTARTGRGSSCSACSPSSSEWPSRSPCSTAATSGPASSRRAVARAVPAACSPGRCRSSPGWLAARSSAGRSAWSSAVSSWGRCSARWPRWSRTPASRTCSRSWAAPPARSRTSTSPPRSASSPSPSPLRESPWCCASSGSERSGLGEVVLSTPTSRARWFAAHIALPAALTAALLALLGAVVGLVGPSASAAGPVVRRGHRRHRGGGPRGLGDGRRRRGVRRARLPRFAPFSWGVLLVTFMVTEIGPLTKLPAWVMDLSPFTPPVAPARRLVRGRLGHGADPHRARAHGRRVRRLQPPRRRLTPAALSPTHCGSPTPERPESASRGG